MELIRKVEMRPDGAVVALPRREVTALQAGDWCIENGHMKAWDGAQWHDRPVDWYWRDGTWSTESPKKSSLDDVEAKLNMVKEARELERMHDLCRAAVMPEHETRILSIRAEGTAETERSIVAPLTVDESTEIFNKIAEVTKPRLENLKSRLGVA